MGCSLASSVSYQCFWCWKRLWLRQATGVSSHTCARGFSGFSVQSRFEQFQEKKNNTVQGTSLPQLAKKLKSKGELSSALCLCCRQHSSGEKNAEALCVCFENNHVRHFTASPSPPHFTLRSSLKGAKHFWAESGDTNGDTIIN